MKIIQKNIKKELLKIKKCTVVMQKKHLISQFKENQERYPNMIVSDDEDLPF